MPVLSLIRFTQKILKIPMRSSETVNQRRADNTINKRKTDRQYNKQKKNTTQK
jgi:hypothetical protein